ncbi:MAG: DUF2911 domain-containing protein [Terracidiphilus sp.]|jgi:hypothetical protein
MKKLLVCTGLLIAAAAVSAQTPAPKPPPKSPAATESVTVSGKAITITYSSPRVNGRAGKLFTKDGQIGHDPTYPVWRAGANAATKLHTEGDLTIGTLAVPKGDYTLYVDISNPDKWVLVVNTQTGQWGTVYDKTKDLGRVPMTMTKPAETIENLKYSLSGGKLTLAWENHIASVPYTVQ